MKHEKKITIEVPDGASNETVRAFLQETLEQYPEKPKAHTPEVGDVYVDTDGTSKCLLIYGGRNIILRNPGGCISEFACGRWKSHDSFKHNKYLGKFSDVYITKKHVAEILNRESEHFFGSCMTTDGRDAIIAEGITADLLDT